MQHGVGSIKSLLFIQILSCLYALDSRFNFAVSPASLVENPAMEKETQMPSLVLVHIVLMRSNQLVFPQVNLNVKAWLVGVVTR